MPDSSQHILSAIELDSGILSTPFRVQTNWHVIAGTLSCGKTTLIDQLANQGFRTVPEGARLYLERERARGRMTEEIRSNLATLQHFIVDMQLRIEGELRAAMGGLFVLYALFHETGLFQGYVAASPSFWFGDKAILAAEEQYAQDERDLQANLFLCVGEKEERVGSAMVSDLIRFSALLEGREYARLTLKRQILADLNHCESVAPGLILGLKTVFSMFEPDDTE